MGFPEKLYELRKARGLSQEKLAEALGVSRQAVSKWEGGQATPDTDKLLAISTYFGVSLDALLKEDIRTDVSRETPPESTQGTDRRRNALGLGLIAAGLVCLAAWALAMVLRPEAAEVLSESSMVTIDGGGILLGLCAAAVVCGIVLLLRKK